jgi:uncharacterized protein YdeI (YjbR/CyaY-like superfamily)
LTGRVEAAFFPTPADFRAWLSDHHDSADELWVGLYKKFTGRPSITWPESVEEALCFGWIDGVRRTVDEDAYMIRFTPRRAGSNWSAVNAATAERLIAEGRMTPAGRRAFDARDPAETRRDASTRTAAALSPAQEAEFHRHTEAWAFWDSQPPGYRRQATRWVVGAKREETRARRLATLIADSASGLRIKELRR